MISIKLNTTTAMNKQSNPNSFRFFTLSEMLYSSTAERFGIDNVPKDERILDNIYNVLSNLDNIRSVYNKPIIITSGYRCPELNSKVGGKINSQHIKGEAADLKWDDDLYKLIQSNFDYDQLLEEKSKNKHWIHISFKLDKLLNRHQNLTLNV